MSNNDLIQDVENAMRDERNARLWKEYGPYILSGVVLAVILTAAISGWRAWNDRVDARDTALLIQAEKAKDAPATLTALDPKLRAGQRTIARFTAIGLQLQDGKNDDALKSYKALAGDTHTPVFFRDLASLLSVRLDWSLHKDASRARSLIDTLKPLMDQSNPWRYQARLTAADIAAHGLNDRTAATAYLKPIEDEAAAPAGLKQEAAALSHVYALQAGTAKP